MKTLIYKLASVLLAASLLFPFKVCAAPYDKGDVNGDGKVTASDGRLVFDYVSKNDTVLSSAAAKAADVDRDGRVTVGDAAQILRYTAGTEPTLPANAIERLNILSPPNKLSYDVGQPFNMSGFVLGVTYTDGQMRAVKDYGYDGYSDTPGPKVITVSCRGRLISFVVTVKEPSVANLEILSPPKKLMYRVGEPLVLNGLSLRCRYENGSYGYLSGYSVNGYEGEPGLHSVTLMYAGKTASFTVGCGYGATVACGGTRLNVRSGGGTGYSVVDAFAENSEIVVFDPTPTNGWVWCYGKGVSGNYVSGYCLAEYLDIEI